MHNTPNMVCVWRHAEHTIYGVLCTLYFLQCTATTTTASADATAATDITATDVATCSVCSQNIVDGEEDALFCEGTCKQWVHRYCAGVPLIQFQSLSASPSPFLCSFCRQSNYDDEIYVLRTAVKSLTKEERPQKDTVAEQHSACIGDCELGDCNRPPDKTWSAKYPWCGWGR